VGRKAGDQITLENKKVKAWSPEAEFQDDHVAGDMAKKAVEFIERSTSGKKPFFLYFAANIPHNNVTPAPQFVGKSACGPYGDFVQELDTHVGWIRAALEKAGALDNTLILFTSDNGGVVAENERLAAQWRAKQAGHLICGNLRGRKHSIYEGGFRVPYIVRWPGQVPAGTTSDALICLNDVLATCAAMLGKPMSANMGEDSFNALAEWKGEPNARVRDSVILVSAKGQFAIRQGDWKLIQAYDAAQTNRKKSAPVNPENQNQLYNLADDPAETKNLWLEKPDIVARLTALLAEARKK
jgi:arylsulfatase A-like enzyme